MAWGVCAGTKGRIPGAGKWELKPAVKIWYILTEINITELRGSFVFMNGNRIFPLLEIKQQVMYLNGTLDKTG